MGRTITGLLFLTNDDILRKRLTQSQSKVKMIYKVTLEKKIYITDFEKLRKEFYYKIGITVLKKLIM